MGTFGSAIFSELDFKLFVFVNSEDFSGKFILLSFCLLILERSALKLLYFDASIGAVFGFSFDSFHFSPNGLLVVIIFSQLSSCLTFLIDFSAASLSSSSCCGVFVPVLFTGASVATLSAGGFPLTLGPTAGSTLRFVGITASSKFIYKYATLNFLAMVSIVGVASFSNFSTKS